MLMTRVAFMVFALAAVASEELSTKEKIRIHKEWLERRAALKAELYPRSNITGGGASAINKLHKSKDLEENRQQVARDFKRVKFSYSPKFEKKEVSSHNDVYPENEKHFRSTTTLSTNSVFDHVTTPKQIVATTPLLETTTTAKRNFSTTPTIYLLPPTKLEVTPSTPFVDQTQSTSTMRIPHKTRAKLKPYPRWKPWGRWSECSRTCGGGVMFQERKCVSKLNSGKRIISKECAGLYRRYHLCNQQDCPVTDVDFRHKQCSSFNEVLFKGKKYVWEPYIKEDAECELNCKPVDMKYFATLNHTVIDGTPCFRPAEYYRKNYRGRAICVDGICKALHASGVITGAYSNSGIIHCGGLLCRPVSGIFTKDPLPTGYVHVTTLPAGASNISITELKNSNNLLVLKTMKQKFLFNGDYTISSSGAYEAAGTIFDYRRIDGLSESQKGKKIEGVTEWITATGPTLEPIQLMVFGEDVNPGVKYEYLLPISSNYDSEEDFLDGEASIEDDSLTDSENESRVSLKSGDFGSEGTPVRPSARRKRKFSWKIVGFNPCSTSCGGGTQTPIIRCVRENPTRYFSPRRCTHSEKPVINDNLLRCNTQPCPAFWRVEEWADCRCHHGEGHREREIRCVQELAVGIVIQVNNAACMEEEPPSRRKCDCPKPGRRRNHHKRIHAHARAPQPMILSNVTHRANYRSEKAGNWLVSDWNQHCSAECGIGVEHRSIFCDRSPPNTDRCDLRVTPDTTRSCQNEKLCESGEWFTNDWGQCSGSCFNLTKSRQVICIRNQLIVDDHDCKANEKPSNIRNCTSDEVEYCKPRWHYSAWSECSKTCSGGTQRRTVKCLELDLKENILKESQKCRYSEREPIYRSCNTQECQDPRVDLIQNDISPDCVDEFPNCHLVVKARLCSYEYYQQNCCSSCRESLTLE